MAINEISNIIQNGLLNIYCGEKKSTNEDKYYLLRLSIKDNNNGSDLIQDLKNEHQLNARNLLNYDIQEYNPIISQNDVVERISTSDTNGYNELMSKLTNIDTSNNIQTKRIKFYVFEYSLNDEKVYIIRRNFNNRSLKRSVFVKLDPEGIYDKLTLDDYLKMDYEIDLLIYGESIY